MGNIHEKFSKKKDYRFLLSGLDGAGKTTILYKLKLGETIQSIPTIGFNVETVNINNLKIVLWDTGGNEKLWPLHTHYFEGM